MEATNPVGRSLLLAVGLMALIGCQSERASQIARGQLPQSGVDPLAPIAPIAPPSTPPASAIPPVPVQPLSPIGPVAPAAPLPPSGLPATNVITGTPIPGAPVPPLAKTDITKVGYAATAKTAFTAADLLKASVPRVKVIAIVGANNVITDQEVKEAMWQQFQLLEPYEGLERQAKEKELYAQSLRKTIERELILDDMYAKLKKANKMNVIEEIKEFAVQTTDRQLKKFRDRAGAKTDDEFAAMLRAQGLTVLVIRRQIERQLMAEQYVNSMLKEKGRRVGLGEIRDYYDKHPNEFQSPDSVKWQHIFISTNRHANPQAAYNHAAQILQLAASGNDFAALAMKYDDGVAKQQKGIGTGEKRGEILPADVEPTVWALKPGQISNVIQTPTGYHIVRIVEREVAGVQPFDTKMQGKIRDKLNDSNYETEYKKLVEQLWRKGVVRIVEE